jgi:lipopolysaccharide/colanic/teichoic acid biosynthesis glycosyltransferase
LWQVSKRGGDDMSAEERIALDVTYARENSFWFDLKLLLKTPFSMIQKENV